MDLIDEENTRYDFSTAFLSPFSYLLVNLLSDFWLDLTNISSKECKESLSSAIDNIDFMQSNSVNYFLSLLQLSLWALNEPGLGSNIVVITASSERSAKL